jgi:hypothetical protein
VYRENPVEGQESVKSGRVRQLDLHRYLTRDATDQGDCKSIRVNKLKAMGSSNNVQKLFLVFSNFPNAGGLTNKQGFVRLEVRRKVEMSMFFWVVTPCGLVARYQRFGGTCCLHLQDVGVYL